MRNPLSKRIIRELTGDWVKYLAVGLLLVLSIGLFSGILVSGESALATLNNAMVRYKVEDGHFELSQKLDSLQLDSSLEVYENFYKNAKENDSSTIRVYSKTDDINGATILEGRLPNSKDEIAIDRVHADNLHLKVGDSIRVGDENFKIVGLIAYINYSALFEKTTDFMLDTIGFSVAMVTEDGFERIKEPTHYSYAWRYNSAPENEKEEKRLADSFMLKLSNLVDYVPRYTNPAITFVVEDANSSFAMDIVLLGILTIIIGFIFAVMINNTITKESSAIGTLLASGYTRWQLIRHYLALPLIITLFSALVGNILGYTFFNNIFVKMYYISYSLPPYEIKWNGNAFILTTLIPIITIAVVDLASVSKLMKHTPLEFLRNELKNKKKGNRIHLSHFSFISRFRICVILQSLPSYITLSIGIFFVSTLLAFAIGAPSTISYYKSNADSLMFAKYQYIVRNGVEADAEKFHMHSLVKRSKILDEDIYVYGISESSKYLSAPKDNTVYISSSLKKKYGIKDTIELEERYEDKVYQFEVSGTYDNCPSLAIFLNQDYYLSLFGEEAAIGYFSDVELPDLKGVITVLTKSDITKICDQLDLSMGTYMTYFQYLCIILSAILMYLLTKTIIEKNERPISMIKILGYTNIEIARLYMVSTTLVVIIADAITTFLGALAITAIWRTMLLTYHGYLSFVIQPLGYIKMYLFILIAYVLVAFLDYIRIKRIRMDKVLKNVDN